MSHARMYEVSYNVTLVTYYIWCGTVMMSWWVDDCINSDSNDNVDNVDSVDNVDNVDNVENVDSNDNFDSVDSVDSVDNVDSVTYSQDRVAPPPHLWLIPQG